MSIVNIRLPQNWSEKMKTFLEFVISLRDFNSCRFMISWTCFTSRKKLVHSEIHQFLSTEKLCILDVVTICHRSIWIRFSYVYFYLRPSGTQTLDLSIRIDRSIVKPAGMTSCCEDFGDSTESRKLVDISNVTRQAEKARNFPNVPKNRDPRCWFD